MLVTIDGDRLRAQPVSAYLERDQDDAEFRDEPGSVISHVKMAAASVTGIPPKLGDNRKVAM
jgi:hypothetical protein